MQPSHNYPALRQLLGKNFCKYTFDRDLRDDEIQALEQFPRAKHPYADQDTFKRKQLLEEMLETNMFSEMIFPTDSAVQKWQDDIDLLALHKMKMFIKNTNK